MSESRTCITCNIVSDISNFGLRAASSDGVARTCKLCLRQRDKKTRKKHFEKNREKRNERCRVWYCNNVDYARECSKNRRLKLKLEFINEYGGKCECCSETMIEFLTVEHKGNDGHLHRKEVGSNQASIIHSIKQGGWDKSKYGLFCFNCNRAKYTLGVCPHGMSRNG